MNKVFIGCAVKYLAKYLIKQLAEHLNKCEWLGEMTNGNGGNFCYFEQYLWWLSTLSAAVQTCPFADKFVRHFYNQPFVKQTVNVSGMIVAE
ncbi:MAG: hypothetical protein EAZ91_18125 [Cytophagales bacterium]|nr:MAG: hypothetical protein EAZ91_18125 [Cytophagales bacterium]